MQPKQEPLPVVKVTTLQPLAICPVTEAGSYPGLSINKKPFFSACWAYKRTSFNGVVPPLAAAPSDFSNIVVKPPALLPGDGLLFKLPLFLVT